MPEANREQELEGHLVRMARGPLIYEVGKYQVWTYSLSIIALSGSKEGVSESHLCIPLPLVPQVFTECGHWFCVGAEGPSTKRTEMWSLPSGDYNPVVATKHTHEIVVQKCEVVFN